MATHSSTVAWKTPWTEEPGRLVHGVAKSWTQLSDFTSMNELIYTHTHTHTHTHPSGSEPKANADDNWLR